MNILFVSSGNSSIGLNPIIKNQGTSLERNDLNVQYFLIRGRGVFGYLGNVIALRRLIKKKEFDIVHAHYSMSGFVAALAGCRPLIVSLMGSDVKSDKYFKFLIKVFNGLFWNELIVKSNDMKLSLDIETAHVIPNGVDMKKFRPIDKNYSLKKVGWSKKNINILFAANASRPEKNYKLANDSCAMLKNKNIVLHTLNNIPNDEMPFYFNSSDLVVLSSLWEGSPNVIKEAVSCNTPVVSTDVGDIHEIIGSIEGCYVSDPTVKNFSRAIEIALSNKAQINCRSAAYKYRSGYIAKKIINLYKGLL